MTSDQVSPGLNGDAWPPKWPRIRFAMVGLLGLGVARGPSAPHIVSTREFMNKAG